MSEANIGFSLGANKLTDKTYVDSPECQSSITQETEAVNGSEMENPVNTAPMTWEDAVSQLGREFATIRQAQRMSIYQIHAQTLVPLHIIQALESGDLKRLPEKIYVQGLIHRLGDFLGLDGSQLVASLPLDESSNSLSTNRPSSKSNQFYLSRFHLYLGYVVLLIAAVSSLSSISNQSPQKSTEDKQSNPAIEAETSSLQKPSAPKTNNERSWNIYERKLNHRDS